MAADADSPAKKAGSDAPAFGSTARREQSRESITKTTITPAPGSDREPPAEQRRTSRALFQRVRAHGELDSAREPYPGAGPLRIVMTLLLSALCLLTVGGAILVLLLWQQDRAAGVLTTQLDRTWDLFDVLQRIERWVAFAVIPVAVAWIVLATINVRRATGKRPNPVFAGASLLVGVGGAWFIGDQIVAGSSDWLGETAGFVLQAIFLAIPLLALERVAGSAESRHGPLRATYLISVAYLAHLEFLSGLSTTEPSADPTEWGRLGAYLVISSLLQVLGSLSANEAARAIENGTQHRFGLRQRFGESLLAQAERSGPH